MDEPADCRYCDTTVSSDAAMTTHLAGGHDRSELSRIDRERVRHHELQSSSVVREVISGGQVSRRATIAGAATVGLAGIGGFGFSAFGASHTEIHSWEDLDNIRNNLGDSYTLMTDLDEDSPGYDDFAGPDANGGDGWAPIGESSSSFTGSFDGNGHHIADLVIDRGGEDRIGLFGDTSGATIENLGVVNVDIRDARDRVGGLVGRFNDTVVSSVYTSGSVMGEDWVGGMIGQTSNSNTIEQSYSTADVTGANECGGLIGRVWTSDSISAVYATGAVTGDSNEGGLIGNQETHTPTLVGSYWDTQSTGQGSSDGGTGRTTDEMQGVSPLPTADGGDDTMDGFDFNDDWHAVIEGVEINPTPDEDGYPILQALDTKTQLDAMGVSYSTGGDAMINIEAGGEVTISNVTISGDE